MTLMEELQQLAAHGRYGHDGTLLRFASDLINHAQTKKAEREAARAAAEKKTQKLTRAWLTEVAK